MRRARSPQYAQMAAGDSPPLHRPGPPQGPALWMTTRSGRTTRWTSTTSDAIECHPDPVRCAHRHPNAARRGPRSSPDWQPPREALARVYRARHCTPAGAGSRPGRITDGGYPHRPDPDRPGRCGCRERHNPPSGNPHPARPENLAEPSPCHRRRPPVREGSDRTNRRARPGAVRRRRGHGVTRIRRSAAASTSHRRPDPRGVPAAGHRGHHHRPHPGAAACWTRPDTRVLLGVTGGCAVTGLMWMAVVVRTYLIGRPRAIGTLRQTVGAAVVTMLCLTLATPFGFAALLAQSQRNVVNTLFPSRPTQGPEGDLPLPAHLNVLLFGSDAGADRTGTPQRLDDGRQHDPRRECSGCRATSNTPPSRRARPWPRSSPTDSSTPTTHNRGTTCSTPNTPTASPIPNSRRPARPATPGSTCSCPRSGRCSASPSTTTRRSTWRDSPRSSTPSAASPSTSAPSRYPSAVCSPTAPTSHPRVTYLPEFSTSTATRHCGMPAPDATPTTTTG